MWTVDFLAALTGGPREPAGGLKRGCDNPPAAGRTTEFDAAVWLPPGAQWSVIEAWNDPAHVYHEPLPMQGTKKRRAFGPRVCG